jgi:hypothetical protein
MIRLAQVALGLAVVAGIAGCSITPAPIAHNSQSPAPTAADDVAARIEACGGATEINGLIANADYWYSNSLSDVPDSARSISADEWIAEIQGAKVAAAALAEANSDSTASGEVAEFAGAIVAIPEVPVAEVPTRDFEGWAPSMVDMCEAAGATYGVAGDFAVGG